MFDADDDMCWAVVPLSMVRERYLAAVAAGAPDLELTGIKLYAPPTKFGKDPAGTMDVRFKVFFPEDHETAESKSQDEEIEGQEEGKSGGDDDEAGEDGGDLGLDALAIDAD